MYNQPITTYEGFSINPAYQTPAYMANFRPAYAADTDPYNSYAINRGYFQALGQQYLFGDRQAGYEADPIQEERANNWSITTQHSDAFVNAITKVGIPVASWYAANKILSRKVGAVSPTAGLWDKGAAFSKALYSGEGMVAARAAWTATAARQTLGGAAGSVLGRAAGTVTGGVLGAGARALGVRGAIGAGASGLGAAGAVIGGGLGSLLMPLAVASMASSAVNNLIADPYVGLRRGEDAVLANTANTFVSRAAGPNYGTFGTSAQHANRLSRAFMDANIRDMGFEVGDYSAIADYGMQMGLFNDIGNMNVDDMKNRVKGMAESVKLIMAVANTSSVKEALQYMSRLKGAGITNPNGVQRVMSELGIASGISGSSVEQIMNTVGSQGQMMAQQRGILPVLGLRSAATAYAGFSNAAKTGTMAMADLATLGGTEGATQLHQQGMYKMLDSAYVRAAANSGVRIGDGNPLDVVMSYGSRRASGPLTTFKEDLFNGSVNISEMMASMSPDEFMLRTLRNQTFFTPEVRPGGVNGKSDLGAAAAAYVANGIWTPEEGLANLRLNKSRMEEGYMKRYQEAAYADVQKQFAQRQEQDGYSTLAGVPVIGGMIQDFRHFGRDATGVGAEIGGAFTKIRAQGADSWDSLAAKFQGKVTKYEKGVQSFAMRDGEQVLETASARLQFENGQRGGNATTYEGFLNEILYQNKLAADGSEMKDITDRLISQIGSDVNAGDLMKYYDLMGGSVGNTWESRSEVLKGAKLAFKHGVVDRKTVSTADVRKELGKAGVKGWADSRGFFDRLTDPTAEYGEDLARKIMSTEDYGTLVYTTLESWKEGNQGELYRRFQDSKNKDSYVSDDFAKIYAKDAKDRTDEENLKVQGMESILANSEDPEMANKFRSALRNIGSGNAQSKDYETIYSSDMDSFFKKASSKAEKVTATTARNNPLLYKQAAELMFSQEGKEGPAAGTFFSMTDTGATNSVEKMANDMHIANQVVASADKAVADEQNTINYLNKEFDPRSLDFLKSMKGVEDKLSQLAPEQSKMTKEMTSATAALEKLAKNSDNSELTQTLQELNALIRKAQAQSALPGSGSAAYVPSFLMRP